jgi:L-alanine-DL-glutamate epimerase-like enolase superfamily enzyme
MRIERIEVFQIDLKGTHGGQRLSGGRIFSDLDSTVVKIVTNEGLVGWGESVPWGSNYMPAFARGVRAGLAEIAPALIGEDPLQINCILEKMDQVLMGHPYVKSAIDIACWDLLGKATGLPVYVLLGGKFNKAPFISCYIGHESQTLYEKAIPYHRNNGCPQFSAKASGDVARDIVWVKKLAALLEPGESLKLDANGGWRLDEALRVARAIDGVDIYFEQPCATYEECRDLRRAIDIPVILDECVTDLDILVRARNDGVLDGVNIKFQRHGGLWHSRAVREFCTALNVPMHVQDSGASEIGNAAIAHFAHSVPERVLLYVWDATNLIETPTAHGAPCIESSRMQASDAPGLGIEPREDVIGQAVAVYE